jgi:hypothetical protein
MIGDLYYQTSAGDLNTLSNLCVAKSVVGRFANLEAELVLKLDDDPAGGIGSVNLVGLDTCLPARRSRR